MISDKPGSGSCDAELNTGCNKGMGSGNVPPFFARVAGR
jgi:hypothetical protein